MKFIVTLIKYCHPAIDSRVGDTRNETNEFGLPSLGLPPLVPIKDPRVQSRDCCQEMEQGTSYDKSSTLYKLQRLYYGSMRNIQL